MHDAFRRFAQWTSQAAGSMWAFAIATLSIVFLLVLGPVAGYSDAWMLWVNTGTTIVTFLVVFLIQNTQNRDATAIHLKLDELIRSVDGARDRLVNLEDCTDEELAEIKKQFERLGERAKVKLEQAAPQEIDELHEEVEELHEAVARTKQERATAGGACASANGRDQTAVPPSRAGAGPAAR